LIIKFDLFSTTEQINEIHFLSLLGACIALTGCGSDTVSNGLDSGVVAFTAIAAVDAD
jgi:hypothetical protein